MSKMKRSSNSVKGKHSTETCRPGESCGYVSFLGIWPASITRFGYSLLCISFCMITLGYANAQLPSFHAVSSEIEVGTVSVAFYPPSARILTGADLSTPANIALLANVQTLCVLPFDALNAKSVIQSLPSFGPIKQGLEGDKSLRQLRNETRDALQKDGFSVVDCIADPSVDADGELVLTKVLLDGLPAYYWVLYAGVKSAIVVFGEKELLGLARPSAMSLPLTVSGMVQQMDACKNAAKRGS